MLSHKWFGSFVQNPFFYTHAGNGMGVIALSSYLVLNAINNKMVKSEFPDLFEDSDNKDYEPE